MSQKLTLIKTLPEVQKVFDYLKDKEFVAFDTETDGVEKGSQIIGFSIGADLEEAYYIVLGEWRTKIVCRLEICPRCKGTGKNPDYENTPEWQSDPLMSEVCPSCDKGHREVKEHSGDMIWNEELKQITPNVIRALKDKNLVMHNAVFDCTMVRDNYGIDLMPSVHTDTMLLAHLLDENRSCGLKDLAISLFGEYSTDEQKAMKESVTKNGGSLTRDKYELYKADADLIGYYGAKDALLTMKLFYELVPQVFEQKLDQFFYEDETMPLLRTTTYDMNTVGLRVDSNKLLSLKKTLEAECMEARDFIYSEIQNAISKEYPGTSKAKTFNINSSKQLAWLLFHKLGNEFHTVTKEGRELCKALEIPVPYSRANKLQFLETVRHLEGKVWQEQGYNKKTKKVSKPKKIGNYWNYLACGKETLKRLTAKYKWVERFLEYAKNKKLLNTYVEGIESRMKYSIIRPNFLQHGTTSGRYSCKNPNFQNLPRGDKRVKSCIIAREGKVFVGADYSQLEPRVFASVSGDPRLLKCFSDGDDFYSVIGIETFEKFDAEPKKEGSDKAFGVKYPELRDISKVVALSATYGTTAFKMAPTIGKSADEAQEVIDSYFAKFPNVKQFQLDSHKQAKKFGAVYNLYGRPRRMENAKAIPKLFFNAEHDELPYNYRNLLNLAVNHRIQSTAASIMNRASSAFKRKCIERAKTDARWNEVFIVLQIHDELVAECPESIKNEVKQELKYAMEKTSTLPGVELIAEPKIGKNLAELK